MDKELQNAVDNLNKVIMQKQLDGKTVQIQLSGEDIFLAPNHNSLGYKQILQFNPREGHAFSMRLLEE